MFNGSYIEIDEQSLVNNINFLKNLIGPNVKVSSVVKGNAYGHSIEIFVPLAQRNGIDHFSVFSADEALRLKKVVEDTPTILVMGMLDKDALEWAVVNGIEFFMFDLERLRDAIEIAKRTGISARIHIELETGMNRSGLNDRDLTRALDLISRNKEHLDIRGVCTHFAGAENLANEARILKQFLAFKKLNARISERSIFPERHHTACSAAALRYPETHLDMVRIGILLYGFFPSREIKVEYLNKNGIRPILKRLISWKSRVMDVKKVKEGEYIGYGTSYLANTEMTLAVIPVGYSHGYNRSLSNRGRVLIHGRRVGIVGMVNMNVMMADVSQLENIKKGDEVVIIGRQGNLEVSVSALSEYSYQVNYETLARLPQNIPRKVISASRPTRVTF